MKKLVRKIMRVLYLPLLVTLTGVAIYSTRPYITAWVNANESNSGGYAIVATQYPELSPGLQKDIAARMQKGFLQNTDVFAIVSAIVDEKGTVQTYPAPDLGDGDSYSISMLDHLMDKRLESHAKNKLIELTGN